MWDIGPLLQNFSSDAAIQTGLDFANASKDFGYAFICVWVIQLLILLNYY